MTAFGSYKSVAFAANQSEPQSGDLCGGTGGKGTVVNVGNNEFTLKRNDDGNSQIIDLTNPATIKTSTGDISLSDLKIGVRVTLVGGPNPDGSFTAYGVFVCSGTQENITGQNNQPGQNQSINFNKANVWSSYLNIGTLLLVSLIWIGLMTFLRLKKKISFVYLLFLTIFYIYIIKVLDYTLFQFQSLIVLKHFMPDLMLRGITAEKRLNLIPLITLRLADIKTSLLNVLLMVPFGFGLPFITNFRMKKIVLIGMCFSIGIEFLQFITGFMANITFRVADINDVIFNTIGVGFGYILFIGFMHMYRHIFRDWKISANPVMRYIAERPQLDKQ